MVEPVTLTAAVIANLAFQKCLEAGAGELGKKFTSEAIAKMDALRQKLWDRLRGRSPKLDEALDKVEEGDRQALSTISKNLDVVMDEDEDFAAEVTTLAKEINIGKLQDNSSMNQVNQDNARGWQTKVEGGTAYVGEIHIHNKESSD